MSHAYFDIAFTPAVRDAQQAAGSRASYGRSDADPESWNRELGEAECDFIAASRSFYLATVSETGWPYLQHRGGPAGFLQVRDGQRLVFADFEGNRQLISVGNLSKNDKVALFLPDYANRARLKLMGRMRIETVQQAGLTPAELGLDGYRARIARIMQIDIDGYDWNCAAHLPQLFDAADVSAALDAKDREITALRAELEAQKRR